MVTSGSLGGGRARRGRAGQSWLARLALASCAVC